MKIAAAAACGGRQDERDGNDEAEGERDEAADRGEPEPAARSHHMIDLVDVFTHGHIIASVRAPRSMSRRGCHPTIAAARASAPCISVIALWLGHEHTQTTQIYLHGDLTIKEQALARLTPPHTPAGRYQPPDELLAFLESL